MTFIYNDPSTFRTDMIDGLLAAYPGHLSRIPDASGLTVSGGLRTGEVSVLFGGGCGHYPAFAGLVGRGLAHGAVIGEIFTSPSARQVYLCTRALDAGAGVLHLYGNYSGDVMNFGIAAKQAAEEGIRVETVLVTDDVASAPADRRQDRRGIAGDVLVCKVAGAAAASGCGLREVKELAEHANARTCSFGVAFKGCTVPGAAVPLFTVADSEMAIGLGIHGEPGIRSAARVSASELARILVDPLLEEAPHGSSGEVVVLLNGLGAVKYEEMFVLYASLAPLLADRGLRIHDAEVGEAVTSLDMAGVSLTLLWLDNELQTAYDAPAWAPGYRPKPGGAR